MNDTEVCATCRFSRPLSPQQAACRRFPPTAHVLMARQANVLTAQEQVAPQTISSMVVVQPDGWCGEYKSAAPAVRLAS